MVGRGASLGCSGEVLARRQTDKSTEKVREGIASAAPAGNPSSVGAKREVEVMFALCLVAHNVVMAAVVKGVSKRSSPGFLRRLAGGSSAERLRDALEGWTAAELDAASDASGKTPLMMAAWRGCEENVQLLLDAGCDVNRVATGAYTYGKSAVFFAATRCRDEVATMLVARGADLRIVNNKGQSPRSLATSHLSTEVVALFEEAEGDGDWRNFRSTHSDGCTYGDLDIRFLERALRDDDVVRGVCVNPTTAQSRRGNFARNNPTVNCRETIVVEKAKRAVAKRKETAHPRRRKLPTVFIPEDAPRLRATCRSEGGVAKLASPPAWIDDPGLLPNNVPDFVFFDAEFGVDDIATLQLAWISGDDVVAVVADAAALSPKFVRRLFCSHRLVAFAAKRDLQALARRADTAAPEYLDLQTLAIQHSLGSIHQPPSLATVVQACLGLSLDKTCQVADWDQRPLDSALLHYAALDAAILPFLLAALLDRGS